MDNYKIDNYTINRYKLVKRFLPFGREIRKEQVLDVIMSLPNAQKQGKWIVCYNVDRSTDVYQCNKCYDTNWYPANYCPNCGVDMRGEDE